MTKTVLLSLLLLVLTPVYSQFDEKIAWKSLVRVQVENNVQSGFLWLDNSKIITALHGMRPNREIKIYYPDGTQSPAEVIRVFEDGDLVLLKASRPAKLTDKVAPITSFNEVVKTGEELTATGFYAGAQAKTTQSFKKGAANPETIRAIAPPNLTAEVNKIQFPNPNFNIYYVSGSLLPGFSGSPVYNKNMELVAIGDGGLDKGQLNVSWCIPAKNIIKLEKSPITKLPGSIQTSSMGYTSDVSITNAGNGTTNGKTQQYQSFRSGNFNFYLTKTRTWEEMYRTTSDPGNMDELIRDGEEAGFYLDYELFDFDIYEDVLNGFVLAVPEDSKLEAVPGESNTFTVTVSDLLTDDTDYFEMFYYLEERQGDPMTNLINEIKVLLSADENGGLDIDERYSRRNRINSEWTADYRLIIPNFAVFSEYFDGNVLPVYYASTIYNNQYSFNSVGMTYFPLEWNELISIMEKGINCYDNNYDNNIEVCDFMEAYMRIVSSIQLTTISTD